jgi:hypothetical protein
MKLKLKDLIKKESNTHKIYVKQGQDIPKGKKMQKGPRGGQYFIGTAAEKEIINQKNTEKSTTKLSAKELSAKDFINSFKNSKLIKKLRDETDIDLNITTKEGAAGACDVIADLYTKYNPRAKVISGANPDEKWGQIDIHVANIVGDKVIDFSHRQFDEKAEIPTVMSIKDFIKKFGFSDIGIGKNYSKSLDTFKDAKEF